MITKYLTHVVETGGNIIVYYNEKDDFYYLPVSLLLKKGLLSNYFKSWDLLEMALGSTLDVVEVL